MFTAMPITILRILLLNSNTVYIIILDSKRIAPSFICSTNIIYSRMHWLFASTNYSTAPKVKLNDN
jgi:hypothetical protein